MNKELTIEYILNNLNPCEEGAEWLKTQPDLQTAWQNCKRGDWMIWLLDTANLLSKQQDLAIQLIVLDMPLANGGKVLDLITDERSLAFIDLKRRRLAGETIDIENWDAARDAARAAARAATNDAAWFASVAAWAAASDAAWAAANDAAWDAARDAAGDAATRTWLANKLRELVPNLENNP